MVSVMPASPNVVSALATPLFSNDNTTSGTDSFHLSLDCGQIDKIDALFIGEDRDAGSGQAPDFQPPVVSNIPPPPVVSSIPPPPLPPPVTTNNADEDGTEYEYEYEDEEPK